MKIIKAIAALLILSLLFPPLIPSILMAVLNAVYEAYEARIYMPLETWARSTWYGKYVVDPMITTMDTWV